MPASLLPPSPSSPPHTPHRLATLLRRLGSLHPALSAPVLLLLLRLSRKHTPALLAERLLGAALMEEPLSARSAAYSTFAECQTFDFEARPPAAALLRNL